MNGRALLTLVVLLFGCSETGAAQGLTRPYATGQLTATDAQGSIVPAGSTSTLLTFTLEADTTGKNFFDAATSDPAVVVSLILPSGTEVTSANAASFGFTFTVVPDGSYAGAEIPSVFAFPGTHTSIQVSAGQVSGIYKIRANASAASADSGILATYFSSSTVGVTATTNAVNYLVGGTVVLSGLVFDGVTPITGATVTAAVSAPVSLAGQASLGNYQLVSQQVVNSTLSDFSYTVTLTNTGPALQSVLAELASLPAGVTILSQTLAFGDVAANASVPSLNSVTIERDPNQAFDPSTLAWNVTSPGPVTNVSLVDAGPRDAASGDGIYTGTFTPVAIGTYTAMMSITGSSVAGNSFSRTAVAQFQVTQQLANFVAFADAQQAGGVTETATINVQTAGTYRFDIQLQASNQNVVQETVTANLSAGSQQIGLTFSNTEMLGLAVNGPYERMNALWSSRTARMAL